MSEYSSSRKWISKAAQWGTGRRSRRRSAAENCASLQLQPKKSRESKLGGFEDRHGLEAFDSSSMLMQRSLEVLAHLCSLKDSSEKLEVIVSELRFFSQRENCPTSSSSSHFFACVSLRFSPSVDGDPKSWQQSIFSGMKKQITKKVISRLFRVGNRSESCRKVTN